MKPNTKHLITGILIYFVLMSPFILSEYLPQDWIYIVHNKESVFTTGYFIVASICIIVLLCMSFVGIVFYLRYSFDFEKQEYDDNMHFSMWLTSNLHRSHNYDKDTLYKMYLKDNQPYTK